MRPVTGKSNSPLAVAGFVLLACFVGPAGAVDASIAPLMATAPTAVAEAAVRVDPRRISQGISESSVSAIASRIGRPTAIDALDELRGGDSTNVTNTTNRNNLNGRVSDNTADRIVSGANLVSDNAFGSSSGISTLIQNSGSNVLIQNAMILNVQFAPPQP